MNTALDNTSVTAVWGESCFPGNIRLNLLIGSENIANFAGDFDNPDDMTTMNLLRLHVIPEARRNKLATRLVSALAYVAISHNVQYLETTVESQHTLKIFRNLFGAQNISYFDANHYIEHRIEFPITTQEAIASLERAEQFETDLDNRDIHLNVRVSLSEVEPSKLEVPVELNKPQLH